MNQAGQGRPAAGEDMRPKELKKRADERPTSEGEVARRTKTQVMAKARAVGDWVMRSPSAEAGHYEKLRAQRCWAKGLA